MFLRHSSPSLIEDESSRSDFPVEWWFVQGRFHGVGSGSREFMLSLFRHALEWKGLFMGNSCTLISSSLDPATGQNATRSIIDPATTPFLVKASRHYPPPGLDPTVVRVVADELTQYGPPRPIEVEPRKASWGKQGFRVDWGDFHLAHDEDHFHLAFQEPGTNQACDFTLVPRHRRLHLTGVEVPGGGAMDYVSYTRVNLAGTVGGEPVTGTAWFDHQWGSQGWVVSADREARVLGWDWLGIQLEDGRDLLVMAHRDMRNKAVLKHYAVLVSASGETELHEDLRLTPIEWWTGPLSGARYPVVWDIRIPSLDLALRFTPSAMDQEIPMLPPIRAVWEGAGRVAGTARGQPVEGWARLELHGYAYVVDISQQLSGYVERARSHLEAFLPRQLEQSDIDRLWQGSAPHFFPSDLTRMISIPLWDMLDRRQTSLWCSLPGTWLISALGKDSRPYEALAAVTAELCRAGGEILDDIQDQSPLRRGEESLHLRYGLNTAMHAGSAALFLPLQFLSGYPKLSETQRLELYRIYSRFCLRAQIGQAQDLSWSASLSAELLNLPDLEARLLQVYRGKDSAFTEAAMEGAAVIAGADPAARAACLAFGTELGLALGIMNDLMNFCPERLERGEAGTDISSGKLTFLIARTVNTLKGRDRKRFIELFTDPESRSQPTGLQEAIKYVTTCGATDSCRQTGLLILENAWRQLSQHLPPSEPKTMLRVLWRFIVDPCPAGTNSSFIPA